MLSIEVGHLTSTQQYAACTVVLFFFTIVYGYLQELVVVHLFAKRHGLFVTLLQLASYTLLAGISLAVSGDAERRIPRRYVVVLAVGQAAMQSLSNLSMRYINYPAKVLFKSSRVVPTMLFGVVFMRKRHAWREVAVVLMMVAGLVIFMLADVHAATRSRHPASFEMAGVCLICCSLVIDAAIINLQEQLFARYQPSEEELVYASYSGGSLLLLIISLVTGEFRAGFAFLAGGGGPWGGRRVRGGGARGGDGASDGDRGGGGMAHALFIVFIFSATGFAGVSAVAALRARGASSPRSRRPRPTCVALSFLLFQAVLRAARRRRRRLPVRGRPQGAREGRRRGGRGGRRARRARRSSVAWVPRWRARRAVRGETDIRSGEHADLSNQRGTV